MVLACLSDVKAHLAVMSWGLKDLCRVMSILAYRKDQTVLVYKKKKRNKGFLIWFYIQWAKTWPQWVSGKASNSFSKARIPNGTSNFHSQWSVTWAGQLQVYQSPSETPKNKAELNHCVGLCLAAAFKQCHEYLVVGILAYCCSQHVKK